MLGPPKIHPTAVVEDGAEIGSDVVVGAHSLVEAGAQVQDGTVIGAFVHVHGCVRLGEGCRVGSGSVLGGEPQALRYAGERSVVRIGARTRIHEHVTVHRSMFEGGETVVGEGVMLMATSHVAHDCRVGDGVILTNGSMLAGHVEVGERAILSGNAGVHQFCRVGALTMVGGGCVATMDLVPYSIYTGMRPARWRGTNTIGLRRSGISSEERSALRAGLRELFCSGRSLREVAEELSASARPSVAEVGRFVLAAKRGVHGARGAVDGEG